MKVIGVLMVFLLVLGCGKSKPPIPEEQMVRILSDVHIAEGLTNNHHPLNMRDSLQRLYLKQIFETHKIDKNKFEEAMAHLHSDPQYLEIVYKKVLQGLNKKTQDIEDEEHRRRNAESDSGN